MRTLCSATIGCRLILTFARQLGFAETKCNIADLVPEGVRGAKGYDYVPFSSSMAVAFILMDRYTSECNLAESFYMATAYLSWMHVIASGASVQRLGADGNILSKRMLIVT
jgi:hypothetical protein